MKLEEKMKEEGYKKKDILCCPRCGEVLDKNSYNEYTEYHNDIIGMCRICGYQDHHTSFLIKVFVKN